MSISVNFEQGNSVPRIVRITTTSTLAQVSTAGWYSNIAPNQLQPSDEVEIAYAQGTISSATSIFSVSISSGVVTLSVAESSVITPTIANHIATYTNTTGTLSEDPATAISGGNIQAGLGTGTAGYLSSFPSASSKGSFRFTAVANTGDTLVTLSNALHGQASVYSIPDSGATTANMIISKLTGTQHITVGSLAIDAGSLTAGIATGGTAGGLTLYPATASNGSFVLTPVGNSGNFAATLSPKSTLGQATVYTIPDPGAATSNLVLSQSTLPTNNVAFTRVLTLTFTQLASAGKVNIAAHPSATSQFAILDIKVLTSTGLSGGGGNRLLAVSDGTIVFNNAGITAAVLGTPIFTLWGGTGNPVAVGTSQVSTAGADVFFQYSGGTTDYTAGSVQIAVTLVQVTA